MVFLACLLFGKMFDQILLAYAHRFYFVKVIADTLLDSLVGFGFQHRFFVWLPFRKDMIGRYYNLVTYGNQRLFLSSTTDQALILAFQVPVFYTGGSPSAFYQ